MDNLKSKENIVGLIDQYILDQSKKKIFELKEFKASDFLSYNRLDIGFKLLYLNLRLKNNKLAESIYTSHIDAFTFGRFNEKGNLNKKTINDFLFYFEETYKSIKKEGFNDLKSLVPINKEKFFINGSHRIAILIYLNKKVKVIELEFHKQLYDYNFFKKRNVNSNYIEKAVKIFTKYHQNSYLAILWPSSSIFHKKIEVCFDKIVYKKEITLSDIGRHNFVIELYKSENWLGSFKNDFQGAKNKMYECFKNKRPLKIIIFQSENKTYVEKLKNKIRNISKLGKHSVHISDDNNYQNILDIIFNQNSLAFINTIKFSYLKKEFDFTNYLKKFLISKNIKINDFIITGSFPMSLYQIRSNNDVDYISYNLIILDDTYILEKKISSHNNQINYYKTTKENLLYDNSNFFYFNDFKILTLDNLKILKQNRFDKKDQIDLYLIKKSIYIII